jgi:hypothetical protein
MREKKEDKQQQKKKRKTKQTNTNNREAKNNLKQLLFCRQRLPPHSAVLARTRYARQTVDEEPCTADCRMVELLRRHGDMDGRWGWVHGTARASACPANTPRTLDSRSEVDLRPVHLAYQPPANSTFLSEQTSHKQPANSIFLSQQTSTSHQPPAKRTCC